MAARNIAMVLHQLKAYIWWAGQAGGATSNGEEIDLKWSCLSLSQISKCQLLTSQQGRLGSSEVWE
jgi:hypothetical protein